jgi:hypothetical protein
MNTIGTLLEINIGNSEDAIVAEILSEYQPAWNKLVKDWIKWLGKQVAMQHPKALTLYNDIAKGFKGWNDYNNRPYPIENIEKLYKLCNIKFKENTQYRHFRKFCAKYYEIYLDRSGGEEWTNEIRKIGFENTIGAYFKSKEKNLKKNVKQLFAAQLSVQDNDYWYIAKGGKDLKLIPGRQRFENGLKNLNVTYAFENSGSGYVIPLLVTNKKKQVLLEVKIMFRWVQGQMFGNVTTTSAKKEYIDDWTEYFTE